MKFDNQVCVVTGAGSGIGRAIAWAFATAGGHVVAVDRDPDALARLAQEAAVHTSRPLQMTTAACDVADVHQIVRTCEDIATRLGGCGAYSASKAATVTLSAQMAVEWGPHGIRSNCISPGMIETALSAPFYAIPGIREKRERLVPMRSIGTPRHVADAVLFLASDAAAYINGHNLVIDGGLSHALVGQIPRD